MAVPKFLSFEELVKDHERLVGEVEELKREYEDLKKRFDKHTHWTTSIPGYTAKPVQ